MRKTYFVEEEDLLIDKEVEQQSLNFLVGKYPYDYKYIQQWQKVLHNHDIMHFIWLMLGFDCSEPREFAGSENCISWLCNWSDFLTT